MTRDLESQSVLTRYAQGERDFRDLDRDDRIYDFSGADLRGAVFSGSYLVADFKGANLEGADFSDCNLKTCDFSDARLATVTFRCLAIDSALFDGADLSGTDFEEATAYGHVYSGGERPPN